MKELNRNIAIAALVLLLMVFAIATIATQMTIFTAPSGGYVATYEGITIGQKYDLKSVSEPVKFKLKFKDNQNRDLYINFEVRPDSSISDCGTTGWFSVNYNTATVYTTSNSFYVLFHKWEYCNYKIQPTSPIDGLSVHISTSSTHLQSTPIDIFTDYINYAYAITKTNECVPGVWKCSSIVERWQCAVEGTWKKLYTCSSGYSCSVSGGTSCDKTTTDTTTKTCYRCNNGVLEGGVFTTFPSGFQDTPPTCASYECYKCTDGQLSTVKLTTCETGWTAVYKISGTAKTQINDVPECPEGGVTVETQCYSCASEKVVPFTVAGDTCPEGTYTKPPATCIGKDVVTCGDGIIQTSEVCDGETAQYFCSADCKTKTMKEEETTDITGLLTALLLGGGSILAIGVGLVIVIIIIAVVLYYMVLRKRKK